MMHKKALLRSPEFKKWLDLNHFTFGQFFYNTFSYRYVLNLSDSPAFNTSEYFKDKVQERVDCDNLSMEISTSYSAYCTLSVYDKCMVFEAAFDNIELLDKSTGIRDTLLHNKRSLVVDLCDVHDECIKLDMDNALIQFYDRVKKEIETRIDRVVNLLLCMKKASKELLETRTKMLLKGYKEKRSSGFSDVSNSPSLSLLQCFSAYSDVFTLEKTLHFENPEVVLVLIFNVSKYLNDNGSLKAYISNYFPYHENPFLDCISNNWSDRDTIGIKKLDYYLQINEDLLSRHSTNPTDLKIRAFVKRASTMILDQIDDLEPEACSPDIIIDYLDKLEDLAKGFLDGENEVIE